MVSVQVMQAHGCQRGIPVLINLGNAEERDGQSHVPAALRPERRPSTHSTGGWLGSRARFTLNRAPHRDSNPKPSSPQPVSTCGSLFNSKRLYIHLPTAQTIKSTGFRRKDRDSILGRGTKFSFRRHIDSYIRNSQAYPKGHRGPFPREKSC